MTYRSLIYIFIITHIASIFCYIPFNPILTLGGAGYEWKGARPGIVGWLEVPGYEPKYVLTIQRTSGEYEYVHPHNFDEQLPQGLFVWHDDWKKLNTLPEFEKLPLGDLDNFTCDAAILRDCNPSFFSHLPAQINSKKATFTLTYDEATKETMWIKKNSFLDDIFHKENILFKPRNDAHPSTEVKNLFTWHQEDAEQGRLFRPGAFHKLMGCTEPYFKKITRGKLPHSLFPMHWEIADPEKKAELLKQFPGRVAIPKPETFKIIILKELYEQYESQLTSKKQGSISIIDGYDILKADPSNIESRKQTDIRFLQATHPNAAYQYASNLNGLEGGVGDPTHYIESMMYRPAQGEEGCIATIGSAFTRKYLIHNKEHINILKHVVDKDGKQKVDVNSVGRITKITTPLTEDDIPNIGIGWHENVMVTSGYAHGYTLKMADTPYSKHAFAGFEQIDSQDPRVQYLYGTGSVAPDRDPLYIYNSVIKEPIIINQVLTAALDVNQRNIDSMKSNNDIAQNIAKLLQISAYQGTILKAIVNHEKNLFLTLVGAGAFQNKLEWINEALESSFTVNGKKFRLIDAIHQSGLNVKVVIHHDPRSDRTKGDDEINKFIARVTALEGPLVKLGGTARHYSRLQAKLPIPYTPYKNSFISPQESIIHQIAQEESVCTHEEEVQGRHQQALLTLFKKFEPRGLLSQIHLTKP
ncbi:MAG: hypothetical protein WC707_03135 [Candidatus Babeliaceae bacterium]|jgi:hypothetical protein